MRRVPGRQPAMVGDTITPKDANYGSNIGKTTEVGSYPSKARGLYDMHGNVCEWVEDVWHDSYKDAPNDGLAWTDGEGTFPLATASAAVTRPRSSRVLLSPLLQQPVCLPNGAWTEDSGGRRKPFGI